MKVRNTERFDIQNKERFIKNALYWANEYQSFNYFCPNNYTYPFQPFKHFLSVGIFKQIHFDGTSDFNTLKNFIEKHNDYLIGHFSYDLKNQLEDLSSNNQDEIDFEDIGFYIPEHIIHFDSDILIESFGDPKAVYQEIIGTNYPNKRSLEKFGFQPVVPKSEYIETVNKLKNHIVEGDIYEINYCQEFIARDVFLDPIVTFLKLIEVSPTPFSVLYKHNDHFLICASPERFLKKNKDQLIAQPIKGTARRGKTEMEDESIKNELKNNEKELAENMMIVDLVRNDLARSCKAGSVKVEEMFGIYTFNQLHQMISTITGKLRDGVHSVEAIKNAFPMGSMTGAPKIKVMELIEKYEQSKRGLYSGSVGYFLPNGDFDFNVVIRSILYNSNKNNCSFQVGGAITFDSIPELEYEECLLKAAAIVSLFKGENTN
ncbi:MAG TPA: anthranilate synthase component I family protein [Fulvivirga sp.]|nr:anthranilate synthase component I family protein [Fulvivirga sp.]